MHLFGRNNEGDDTDDDNVVDPELRLRTTRTAASTIAESIRSEQRRTTQRRKTRKRKGIGLFSSKSNPRPRESTPAVPEHDLPQPTEPVGATSLKKIKPGARRNIHVNISLPEDQLRSNGDPIVAYVRNKVRTSKYTALTFLPKNLSEQFRRVANVYFLALVIIQVFPLFGAAAPQVAMLPLVFILTVTAIKDGIEDYRRASLDDQVNNSAATKLGNWRNVNQLKDPREWYEKLLGIGSAPGKVTKGVKKLREKEAAEGKEIVLVRQGVPQGDAPTQSASQAPIPSSSSETTRGRSLEDIQSVNSHTSSQEHQYPPTQYGDLGPSAASVTVAETYYKNSNPSLKSWKSGVSAGVVDWKKRTPGTAQWERTLWKKLDVGDIVLLRDNDQVPADIIVLSTSDSDGVCYVETKNLDGETNLKPRRSLKATCSILSEEDLEHAFFILDSEPPHANLYTYNGVLHYRTQNEAGAESENVEPVTINEMLLRGCSVRNTNWVIGLVAYTGADTKIMLNGGETPSKRSKIERETNFNVIMNFIILMLMCIVTGIASGYMDAKTGTSADFFEVGADVSTSSALNAVVTATSCLIAFQNIVPVSLYISIEIVKTIQAYFINQDIEMYYAPYDTCCVPKTWNISDDLGQIEYIFSDKTGTLTQNIMEFQKCSINGVAYGEGVTEAMRGAAKRVGTAGEMMTPEEQNKYLAVLKEDMLGKMSRAFKNRWLRPDKLTLISPRLAEDLTDRSSPQRSHIIGFFRALAVCHTVLADKHEPADAPRGSTPTQVMDYKAESPDEAALVGAARDAGFPFINRTTTGIDIEVMGQAERYIPLKVLEFNSTRKRMSVVVRNPEGRLVLYTKGADSVIYARLDPRHNDPTTPLGLIKATTASDMEKFANAGLRTLCVAYRYLTEEEYFDWARVHDAAASAVKDRDEEIEKACELVEKDLIILGATALEDKLQEGVPEAIELLHQAGIKLWILTGDKLQTAIEIGYSCNLLKNDMEMMILSADSPDAARLQIEGGLNKIASILGPPNVDPHSRKSKRKTSQDWHYTPSSNPSGEPPKRGGFAVVIDGDTLRYALDPSLKPLFLNLGTQCDTVVCCRVSPAQKALTVKLVKEGRQAMTLAIGDGANDVAMIQEANIGCGLFGLEGSQAAMSADYAFGQFRFITKLLLVHGRWSYQRVADMHSNFFYKNVIWTFAMFWYLFWNSFDATYLYDYTFIILYNLAFTSLPVIVMGAFDQDLNAKASLAYPQLYKRNILGLEYTRGKFWAYMLDGLYQSVAVFFIPFGVWSSGLSFASNGRTIESLSDFGTTVSVSAIFAANIFVGLNTSYWTWIMFFVTIGSNVFMMVWISIYSFFPSMSFYQEIAILGGTIDFWATVLIAVVAAIGPRYLYKYASEAYSPLDKEIVREMWVKGDLKDRLGIKRRSQKAEDRALVGSGSNQSSDVELDHRAHYRPTSISRISHDLREPDSLDPPLMRTNDSTPSSTASPYPTTFTPQPPQIRHDDIPPQQRMSYYSASELPSNAASPIFPPSPTSTQQTLTRGNTAASTGYGYQLHPGEYEMSPRPGLHTVEESSYSRASGRSYVTADEWQGSGHSRTNSRSGNGHSRNTSGFTDTPHAL